MEALLPSKTFPYLGRTITYNNRYWAAVYQNLRKAQRRWEMIKRVLSKTGATVRDRGMMYKVVTQSVILYGSDRWLVTGNMLKVLEGFHNRTARWITGMMATRGAVREW